MNPQLMQQMMMMQQGMKGMPKDINQGDDSESVIISGLALIKMLKHGRAGVPIEVIGLMVGEFVDEFTVKVVDVFAVPQAGTAVSVESIDPVFQQRMLEMLYQTGRPEKVVGWYHSHPGYGCWFSGADENMQMSYERLHPRCVGVVVDPIRSVRGRVVIDCFREIQQQFILTGMEPRQTTSIVGPLAKPSILQLAKGLNKTYYKMPIRFRLNDLEQKMLLKLNRKTWTDGLRVKDFKKVEEKNTKLFDKMLKMCNQYNEMIKKERELTREKMELYQVGRLNAKKHIKQDSAKLLNENVDQALGSMLSHVIF